MNDKPLISAIVPMYNCEKYIAKCIGSLSAQTYDNLEIIIVDDGSEDRSGEICREYASRDKRICYIRQENMGASAARNNGLSRATGEWIAFCDSDDYMENDMLEYLFSLAVKYHADIAQCGTIKEYESTTDIICRPKSDVVIDRFIGAEKRTLKFFSNTNWCKLYKRKTIENISFESFVIGEDLLFNIKAALAAGRIVLGSCAKYHYVQRRGSICSSAPTPSGFVSMRNVLKKTEEMLNGGNAARYYHDEQIRNDFNICSLYVRFLPENSEDVIGKVRSELRKNLGHIMAARDFTAKEKVKALLISFAWRLYAFAVRGKKRGEPQN